MVKYGNLTILDKKGNPVGTKVVKMPSNLLKRLKGEHLGADRYAGGLVLTNITNLKKWRKIPREKRFSKKYFPIQTIKLNRII